MLGWNSTVLSSWKLETSRTDQVSGVLSSMSPTTGTPMLPPTRVGRPASLRISPSRAVVVVLPLEPVMATTLPLRKRAASSSSPMTGRPKLLTWTSSGVSRGTPGLTTIRSCRRKVSRPWPPASTMMPSSRSAGMSLASASALRTSETVTCAPLRRRNRAAARPDFPSPTTRTFLPLSSIILGLSYGFCGFCSVTKNLALVAAGTFQLLGEVGVPSTWLSGRKRQSNSTAETLSWPWYPTGWIWAGTKPRPAMNLMASWNCHSPW